MRVSRPDPVPLRIGVYFPPELRDFTYRHHATDTGYVLGEPSVRLLKEELGLLFSDVVESPLPASDSNLPKGLAAVIEPRISSAGFEFKVWHAHVTYSVILHTPNGERVASWKVTGWGRKAVTNPFAIIELITRNFETAMQEAALELTLGFRHVPEIQRWLDEQGVR